MGGAGSPEGPESIAVDPGRGVPAEVQKTMTPVRCRPPAVGRNHIRLVRLGWVAAVGTVAVLAWPAPAAGAILERPPSPAAAAKPNSGPSGYTYESWTIRDGLPVNSVNAVSQSPDGYLWLATFDGLVRFDGVRFTVFDVANTPSLPSNRIVSVRQARRGGMWIWTQNGGVVRYRDGRFSRLDPPEDVRDTETLCVHEDADDVLWVGRQSGLWRLEGERLARFAARAVSEPVLNVYRDRAGSLWLYVRDGLARLAKGTITRFACPAIRAFYETDDGRILVGTLAGLHEVGDGGLTRLTPERMRALPPIHDSSERLPLGGTSLNQLLLLYGTPDSEARPGESGFTLSRRVPRMAQDHHGALWYSVGPKLYRDGRLQMEAPDPIESILPDADGSIWLGTFSSGLHCLRPAQVITHGAADGGKANLYSVLEDSAGTIWVAGLSRGVGRIHDGDIRWLPERVLGYCLGQDHRGRLFVGTAGAGVYEIRGERLAPFGREFLPSRANVFFIQEDRVRGLWVGTDQGLFCLRDTAWTRYGLEDGLPNLNVRAFLESRDGALWFGTNGGGIAAFRDLRFQSLGERDGLPSNLVRSLYEDERGVLWVGTEGRGLARIERSPGGDLRRARIASIRKASGLYDDVIHCILPDGRGRLWMSSNRGIFWIDRDDLNTLVSGRMRRIQCTAYTERDGMRNRECNGGTQPAGARTRDGRLWFVTQDGAVEVDPARIVPELAPPSVAIEQLETREGPLAASDRGYRLTPTQRDFEVVYTGISLLSPDNVRFRYRLEGLDHDWVYVGGRRSAFYTHVPPGRYRFLVTASNESGRWSDPPAALPLTVLPRFYETLAFRVGVVVLLLGLAFVGYRARVRGLEARQRELAAQVTDRTRELAAATAASERARQAADAARAEAERNRDLAQQALVAIEAQARALKELDAAKSRFFANVSHEFRTPLTLTIGPIQDVLTGFHGELPAEAQPSLELAVRNAQRVLALVNQLLDLAKLESGEMKLQARPGNLAELVRDVLASFQSLFERRRVALTVDLPDAPVEVWHDARLMEQVMTNLISNGAKYAPESGAIRVHLGIEPSGDAIGYAEVSITDNGPGIPAEQLERVFDRFYQAGTPSSASNPGTGIGLALAREVVELHGGRIRATSEIDRGATFTVTLPLGRSHLREDQIATGPGEAPGASPFAAAEQGTTSGDGAALDGGEDAPTVLVVEDHDEVRAYIRAHLAERYRVIEAADGNAGLERVRREIPDLVVSDVMMPGLDGFGLCRAMKEDPELDFIPVILLTARASVESRIEGLEQGADDYLAKPFHAPELVARVRNLITNRQRLRERMRAEAEAGIARGAPRAALRPSPTAVASADEVFLARVHQELETHHGDENFGAPGLAKAVGQDRSHLYRRLQALLGQSAETVLQGFRLDRAAQLLERRAGSVGEIAYAVGFKNLSHFTRQFRTRFGVTPGRYAVEKAAEKPSA